MDADQSQTVLSDRFKVLCLIGKAASYWRILRVSE